MEYKKLANGIQMPMLGMGGWAQKENEIRIAFEAGYRLVDTAAQYGNEGEVGNAIAHSGIKREDIFLTTKLWNDDVRARNTRAAFEKSLSTLKQEYVDLYLIHYPAEGFLEAWEEMLKLYDKGLVRTIGVSNFQPHHIEEIAKRGYMLPHVNQVEEHPYFSNNSVVDYCKEKNIAVEAWCPLGGPGSGILRNDVIAEIGKKHEKSPAQVILRWQLQRDIISIPKSADHNHMKSNLEVFDFELSVEEMGLINGLNRNARLGADPDNFSF